MQTRLINNEVLYVDDVVVSIKQEDISSIKAQAQENERKRIRICAHRSIEDSLHEMLIVHTRDTYVRPHKHLSKSESFHVIEGRADIVLFDEMGNIINIIRMSDYSSGLAFYYRIADPIYHTLLIRSDILVFHESTNGPFSHEDTAFPSWSPDGTDLKTRETYIKALEQQVKDFLSSRSRAV